MARPRRRTSITASEKQDKCHATATAVPPFAAPSSATWTRTPSCYHPVRREQSLGQSKGRTLLVWTALPRTDAENSPAWIRV